eukprot:CAMPEP_0195051362 /NCGR_PEP_ID=MMETSP0448-20130528/887_1 /TAXON_ID=66468 /ORGANISM="Heterocapsa triquestra, Strain CCMP 448" /LENGTH=42 /DNA_ID= /DNA_START= /DNA_END= /DNA_ORIENTATION=
MPVAKTTSPDTDVVAPKFHPFHTSPLFNRSSAGLAAAASHSA